MTETLTERDNAIVDAKIAGKSYGQLAKEYGVSRNRIVQIYNKASRIRYAQQRAAEAEQTKGHPPCQP